jgi:hypothetical protein
VRQEPAWGQFYSNLCHQSRAAFAQLIFDDFNGNSIGQKCVKIGCSVQKLQPKISDKISAEM